MHFVGVALIWCALFELSEVEGFDQNVINSKLLEKLNVNLSIDDLLDLIKLAKQKNVSHRFTPHPVTTELSLKSENDTTSSNDSFLQLWKSYSWFPDNYLTVINTHWLKFPPQPKSAHYFLAVLYIMIMLTGVFGNSLVILMFLRCRTLRSPANILITNLAVSDLMMMCTMPLFIYNSIHRGFALGETGCHIYGFLGGLTGTVSIVTLAAIASDRYYVVVYPLNRNSTKLRSKVCIIIAWVYGCTFASLPLLGLELGSYVPEGYLTSCSFDYLTTSSSVKNFILVYFCAAWVAPFLLISFCYYNIIKVVIQARNIGRQLEDPGGSGRHVKDQEKTRTEIRLALVVLLIIGLWFLAWTPYAIVALLGIFGKHDYITPFTSVVPALFCKMSSCLDPFVYAVTHSKFREELKNLFTRQNRSSRYSNKKIWSTNVSHHATMKREFSSENGVEEIIVEIPNHTEMKTRLSCAVTPAEKTELSDIGTKNRASWIMKPNFSNRSSSLRSIARTWNRSREHSHSLDEEQ